MDREELKELSRSLQRLSRGATRRFVWVPGPRHLRRLAASEGPAPAPRSGAPPPVEVPPILADLLRSVGPPGALRERVTRAIRVAGQADRRVGRAMGAMIRSGPPALAGREELDALSVELSRLADDLDADIASVNAALRALDQSLPERAETEEDQSRLGKLREAATRLGGVARTQREARGRVGEVMRLLGDLDETLSALHPRGEGAEGE